MAKEFVLQTIKALNFNLFKLDTSRAVFDELGLTIYKKKRFVVFGTEAIIAIIGESHFFWLEGVCLEVLACTKLDSALPNGVELLHKVKGYNLRDTLYVADLDKLTYRAKVEFRPYGGTVCHEPIEFGDIVLELEESFPFEFQKNHYDCRTAIKISKRPNAIKIATAHDYPLPDKITVCTTSFLILK